MIICPQITKLIHKQTITVLFGLLLFFPDSAVGQEAKLTNLLVSNNRDNLIIYCKAEGVFTEKIKKAIISGVPITFSFIITLSQVRDFWPDKKIIEKNITHSIKYSSLKKEYTITRSWESGKSSNTKAFTEAQKKMSKIDNFYLITLNRLEKGQRYQIQAKAKLIRRSRPFYLRYFLFFISMWDFETEWSRIDFIY